MALPFHSYADAKPFKFLVGAAGKPFFVHAKLAAHQSSTLATLIEGAMIEAKREYAVFDDVDEETFIRFMQFAYTGDYSVAEPDVVLFRQDIGVENGVASRGSISPKIVEEPDGPAEEPPPPEDSDAPVEEPPQDPEYHANSDIYPASGERKSKGQRLWESFQDKANVNSLPTTWEPRSNKDECEDYIPVFLCHAKLYVFADKYGIKPLQELVLQKLRLTLSRFILYPRRVGDVIELMRYTYEHTTEYVGGSDRLRDLVADYVVCHIEKIMEYGDFTKLMQENGDVTKDIMPKLMERVD
ncbi:hypothetical protein PV04_04741 [Phialophora macrospora]|uniref:BTB domain-containing protein n=1 Tax=Phialophora macrospora TaxID=1851006 RepID=A0A0D2CUG8_9EURO|nr:hypothetical protein PV04_04741 [Phialophora macrospora]